MPSDHQLATSTQGIRFAELAGQPVVHYHHDNGLSGWLDEVAARHQVTLAAVMRTRQTGSAAQLAAAGLGVALVPTTALTAPFAGALRHLEPVVCRDLVALVGSSQDVLVQRFVADLEHRGVPVPADIKRKLCA